MKTLTTILALLIAASFCMADYQGLPDPVKANLSTIQKYPIASNILLWCAETYALNADGSQSYEWHSFRYLPDEAARDAWGDPHIAFLDGPQKLEIITARTYTADGRQIDCTPANAFNPIVPEEGFDLAPDFSAVRQMVVTMLGLENGSISELHYRITTHKPILPWLEGRVYFREEWPVISRELTVNVPSGTTLMYKAQNGVNESSKTGTSYTWSVGEQPGYLAEDLAGHRVLLPNVAFTTAKDWKEVADEFGKRIESARKDLPELPASLIEELQGIDGSENRLDVIKKWVRERFNHLEFELPEYEVGLRPVQRILTSGYGNSFEMAVLVSGLAKQAGIEVAPLPFFPFEPPVPSIHDLAHWLIRVSTTEEIFESDPLNPREDFSRQNRAGGYYLSVVPPASKLTPWRDTFSVSTGTAYELSVVLESLDKDTLSGHGRIVAHDGYAPFEIVRSGGAESYVSAVINIAKLSVTETQLKNLSDAQIAIDFQFIIPKALEEKDDFRVLPTNVFDFAKFVDGAPLGLTAREFPQEIPLAGDITTRVEISIPGGWKIENDLAEGESKWNSSFGKVNVKANDNHLVIERALHLEGEWLPSDHWPSFREWMLLNGTTAAPPVIFNTKHN
ncbi:MAG: DUF3857 domain-containing protein [Calditrichota bacterium]